MGVIERKKRIEEIDGVGCEPVLVSATTEEILEWIGEGLKSDSLRFPRVAGPIRWPLFSLAELLRPIQ